MLQLQGCQGGSLGVNNWDGMIRFKVWEVRFKLSDYQIVSSSTLLSQPQKGYIYVGCEFLHSTCRMWVIRTLSSWPVELHTSRLSECQMQVVRLKLSDVSDSLYLASPGSCMQDSLTTWRHHEGGSILQQTDQACNEAFISKRPKNHVVRWGSGGPQNVQMGQNYLSFLLFDVQDTTKRALFWTVGSGQ